MDPGDGLHKEVVPPDRDMELARLKSKIDRLRWLYVVLFGTSVVVLVLNWQGGMPKYLHLLWGGSLLGAVITRLTRQSLVNKYNSLLVGGRPGQLT